MIDKLEKALGLEQGTISKAVAGDEIDFNIDDFKIMKSSDFETLNGNFENELKEARKEGEQKGVELFLKEKKAHFELDFEGRKNPDKFFEAYDKKLKESLSIEPNEQISSLTKDVEALKDTNSQLENKLSEKDNQIIDIESKYRQKEDNTLIRGSLKKEFEKYAEKTNYKTDDLIDLFTNRKSIKVNEGNIVFYDGEELIKNDNRDAVGVDFMVESFMNDGYIKKVEGGRAGDETPGTGKYSMKSFNKHMEGKGHNVGSIEYNRELNQQVKEGNIELD